MSLITMAMARPRSALMLLLFLWLLGAYSYMTISKESNPDIKIPIIYVIVPQEGISPLDSERLLVRPLEQALRSVEGVKEMRSEAYEGAGYVLLEFEAGFDSDIAYTDVKEEVDSIKGDFPEEANEPLINEVSLSEEPIIVVQLSSLLPERATGEIAEDIADEIEAFSEVLEVRIRGKREEVVEFILKPDVMEFYGLDIRSVTGAFGAANRVAAAGRVRVGTGEFSLSLPGLFESIDDIMNMPIINDADAVVTVRDVATVQRTFKDASAYSRLNGRSSMALEVVKRSGENIIDTVAKVKALVAAVEPTLPEGINITFSNDQSTFIERMLNDLENSVILSVFLVVVVILAFLGIRGGVLVGISIPGSFLSGILVLFALGLTVNMVVLFALILSVGLLVDGAIVMVEYADREIANGVPAKQAYTVAAQRMSWPIIVSTLTTLLAFLPLMFWPGIVGQFMQYLPLTLIAVLTSSLFMALLFMPVVGAYLTTLAKICLPILAFGIAFLFGSSVMGALGFEGGVATGGGVVVGVVVASVLWRVWMKLADLLSVPGRSDSESNALPDLDKLGGFTRYYINALRFCLRTSKHAAVTVIVAVLTLIMGWWSYGTYGRGVEFFPDSNPEQITVSVSSLGDLTAEAKDELVRDVEQQLLEMGAETGEFETVYASSGEVGGNRDQDRIDLIGRIYIKLADWQIRRDGFVIKDDILARVKDTKGVVIEVTHVQGGPPTGKPVSVNVEGQDVVTIQEVAREILGILNAHEAVRAVQDTLPPPGIEWRLNLDRTEAAKFGFDVSKISSFVRLVTGGAKLSTYRPDDSEEEIDVRVRFPEEYRNLSNLDNLRLPRSQGGAVVPLSHFISREIKTPTGRIKRINGQRLIKASSELVDGYNVAQVVSDLEAEVAKLSLPKGVKVRFVGENQDQDEASSFLMRAFFVAVFMIAAVLVTQFNSFYYSFIILLAVVMSTTGVGIGLLLLEQPFGIIMSGIGVISLAGIVVNNNIVLLDTYAYIRKKEENATQALLYTASQRLRPVMLTTVTTILGLLPMALGFNVDFFERSVEVGAPSSQFWRQLANAIVCGLAFATLLTLFITPCLLKLGSGLEKKKSSQPKSDEKISEAAVQA